MSPEILDPSPGRWNPFDGRHPLLRGIDPLRALRIAATRRRADAVVSVFEGAAIPLAALRAATSLARLRRVGGPRPKLVLWDIGLTDTWRLRRRLQDFLVPRVDAILVLGQNQKAAIEARWPDHAPVEVVGHLVETGFWRAAGPPPPDGTVLAVGDDVGRDYPTLLAALDGTGLPTVIRTGQRLALGAGHADTSVLAERLPYVGLRDLYERAAFVVVPLAEAQNASGVSAVLEAGAMGRAVVVSRSSGIADYVVDGVTGLVVERHDPDALRAAILRLRAEPALASRMGEAARAHVAARHSTEAFAPRLAAALRRCVETHSRKDVTS